MNLPSAFLTRMQEMLGEEYEAFLQSYESGHYQSLRLNPRKTDREEFTEKSPFHLTPVAWEKNGFYYSEEDTPGKHPYHEAGVYYIQEASAMAPVGYLDVQPGDYVLDLCAAPGGESTQIGAAMQGKGILICNEIHPARAKILSENVERMGLTNAVVTNESPERLSTYFPEYFDKILVDAPCSGEGMFRKEPAALAQHCEALVKQCAELDADILDSAAAALAPGGELLYSTCTFAPEEDEGQVAAFLQRHPEFMLADVLGKPMIYWVYKAARACPKLDDVLIATDDERIADACKTYDMRYIMTSPDHDTPTGRIWEVSTKVEADLYLQIMGDEPLINVKAFDLILPDTLPEDPYYVAVLTNRMEHPADVIDFSNQKVVTNAAREILMISRSPIPYPKGTLDFEYEKVTGIQLYSRRALAFYHETPKSILEKAEENDMMRFVENGHKVHAIVSPYKTVSVDTPKDLALVSEILKGKE